MTFASGLSFLGGFTMTAALPSENTAAWFGGGRAPASLSTVQRITFATDTATATTRGPLSLARYNLAAAGNFTDGWFGGGAGGAPSSYASYSIVDRITYATDTATTSVRGPLSAGRYQLSATGNATDGWFGGGYKSNPTYTLTSTVDRITYATDTATASVRGPLSLARKNLAAAGNSDYGWFGGGLGPYPTTYSTVDQITYATDTATASVRGPLSLARYYLAAAGNTTDGWFGGGYIVGQGYVSRVDRITYATDTATASVRGPLSAGRAYLAAAGNTTDGWFGGGITSPTVLTVNRITYATDTATASVRGPLSYRQDYLAAAGGIQ